MKEELKEKLKKKNIKKKVIGGATAAGLSVSVLLAGLFQSPEELTKKNTQTIRQQETPIVMMMDLDADDADPEDEGEADPEEEKKGIFARIKKKILQLPAAVRALVGVPLWAVGWVIIHFASLAWSTVLHPVLGIVLKWVLAALILLAVYASDAKHTKARKNDIVLFLFVRGKCIILLEEGYIHAVWKIQHMRMHF